MSFRYSINDNSFAARYQRAVQPFSEARAWREEFRSSYTREQRLELINSMGLHRCAEHMRVNEKDLEQYVSGAIDWNKVR